MKYWWFIVLGAIPLVNNLLQVWYAKKVGKLDVYKKIVALYYSDWLLIPFNILLPLTVNFSFDLIVKFFIFSVVFNILTHKYWRSLLMKSKKKNSLGDGKTGKWLFGGYLHISFSILEITFALMFLFSTLKNTWVIINSIILIIFFLSMWFFWRKEHPGVKAHYSDQLIFLIGPLIGLAKLLHTIFI